MASTPRSSTCARCVPLDIETIEQVGREDRPLPRRPGSDRDVSGFGAELAALVQERCFYHLEAPVERVDRLGHALSARL